MNPNAPPPPPAPADKKEVVGTSNTNAANVNSNSNASNSAPPTVMTPSSNTEALVKAHQAGWEAFKARDAKYFNDNVASNFGFADPGGGFIGSKAEAIKLWTETMKCEGITTVKFSEGFGVAVSPTVEVLTGKGTADGTCDGQKNGTLLTTAVYVKEGDAWKLAYMMESPAM